MKPNRQQRLSWSPVRSGGWADLRHNTSAYV